MAENEDPLADSYAADQALFEQQGGQPDPSGGHPQRRVSRITNGPWQPPTHGEGLPLQSQTQTTPQAPPPPPPPFTQADSLQLQRLNQGLSTVQQQIYSGEINDEQGQQYREQIQKQLGPLTDRQQKQQQEAEQKGIKQAMQASALQESIQQTHAVKQAEGFPQTVATFTDSVTGRTEHFYQDERGKFKPIEFKVETDGEQRQADYNNTPDTGSTAPSQTMAAGGPQESLDSPPPQEAAPLPTVGSQAAQPGTPKILNQFGTEIPSAPETPRGSRDEWGRPTGASGTDAFAEMFRRADAAIPRLGANASPLERLHRQEQVGALANKQMDRLSAAQEHREREQSLKAEHARTEEARTKEHARAEESKSAENQRKEAAKAAADKKVDQSKEDDRWTKRLDHHEKVIHDETMEKNPDGSLVYPYTKAPPKGKEYLQTEETRHAEASRRVARERKELHLPEAAKPGAANTPADAQGAAAHDRAATAAQPNPGKPLTDEVLALQDKDATHERVGELLDKAQAAYMAIPAQTKAASGLGGADNPTEPLAQMVRTLQAARTSGNGMTIGQRKVYEEEHSKLTNMMKSYGQDAEQLRVKKPKE